MRDRETGAVSIAFTHRTNTNPGRYPRQPCWEAGEPGFISKHSESPEPTLSPPRSMPLSVYCSWVEIFFFLIVFSLQVLIETTVCVCVCLRPLCFDVSFYLERPAESLLWLPDPHWEHPWLGWPIAVWVCCSGIVGLAKTLIWSVNLLFNKVLAENENRVLYFYINPNELFGHNEIHNKSFQILIQKPCEDDKGTRLLKGSLGTPGGLPSPEGPTTACLPSLPPSPAGAGLGSEWHTASPVLSFIQQRTNKHPTCQSCSLLWSNTTFVILKANQCGISKIGTPLGTENRMVIAGGPGGRGDGELLFNVYKVSVMQDEQVLEFCCTTLHYG